MKAYLTADTSKSKKCFLEKSHCHDQSPALAPICLANLMNTSSSVALATPQSRTARPVAALPAMVANTRLKLTWTAAEVKQHTVHNMPQFRGHVD